MYKETELKNQEAALNKNSDEQNESGKRKYYARKIKRYKFVDDRILMYSDEDVHDKMVSEFREQLGKDEFHTEEKLQKLGPQFGIIILKTNRDKKSNSPEDVYSDYKKRWKIETHYNFVENIVKFYGLKTDDYM